MAEQDFANLNTPSEEDVRPMSQTKVLFLVLLALAVVAGGFVTGFMLGQEIGEEKASSEEKERLVKQLKMQQEELARLRAEARKQLPQVSTTQVGELTFYNELPKQSVEPEPLNPDRSVPAQTDREESVPDQRPDKSKSSSEALLKQIIERELTQGSKPEAVKSSKAEADGSYYLQLASFQKRSDAEKFYPKLASAGLSGVVKQVEIPKLGQWYRVYAGPYASRELAEKAKRDVKSKMNISGLIVKGS